MFGCLATIVVVCKGFAVSEGCCTSWVVVVVVVVV